MEKLIRKIEPKNMGEVQSKHDEFIKLYKCADIYLNVINKIYYKNYILLFIFFLI